MIFNVQNVYAINKNFSFENLARKMNHAEVIAEDARNKLPANFESRQRQAGKYTHFTFQLDTKYEQE